MGCAPDAGDNRETLVAAAICGGLSRTTEGTDPVRAGRADFIGCDPVSRDNVTVGRMLEEAAPGQQVAMQHAPSVGTA